METRGEIVKALVTEANSQAIRDYQMAVSKNNFSQGEWWQQSRKKGIWMSSLEIDTVTQYAVVEYARSILNHRFGILDVYLENSGGINPSQKPTIIEPYKNIDITSSTGKETEEEFSL